MENYTQMQGEKIYPNLLSKTEEVNTSKGLLLYSSFRRGRAVEEFWLIGVKISLG